MFELIPFNNDMDLSKFYAEADKRGLYNNSSKEMLIDSISYESEWQVWILYYNGEVVGTTGAHSFPEMGPDSYRIGVRTCTLTHKLPINNLRTMKDITTFQSTTGQFFIPVGIEWAGRDKNIYITTNKNSVGSQRRMHNIVGPAVASVGALSKCDEIEYRDTKQTPWKVNVEKYYRQLEKGKRWPVKISL